MQRNHTLLTMFGMEALPTVDCTIVSACDMYANKGMARITQDSDA